MQVCSRGCSHRKTVSSLRPEPSVVKALSWSIGLVLTQPDLTQKLTARGQLGLAFN